MRYIIFILIGSMIGLNSYRLKQIEKIEAQNRTLTEQVNKFNDQIVESNRKLKQANDDYEQAIKKQNVQVKTVKQTIQKIVNNPIYRNICINSTACTKSTIISTAAKPLPVLTPPPNLNKIESGDGKTVTLWIIDTVSKYKNCQSQVNSLIDSRK